MMVNKESYNQIPSYFSCVLKAFELTNSAETIKESANRISVNMAKPRMSVVVKMREEVTPSFSKGKQELFAKLKEIFNLTKIRKDIIKMIKLDGTGAALQMEISKFIYILNELLFILEIFFIDIFLN